MPDSARNRWLDFSSRLGAKGNLSRAFALLAAHYAEPNRAYHNLRHIIDCLNEFDGVRHLADNQDSIEMAIWYHDIIYDPRAKDNEERSAEVAASAARASELPDAFASEVASLIMATKHIAPAEKSDSALLVDIDLAILGQPPARFDEYERDIRHEYQWVDDAAFAKGRSAILKSFLQRPSIYCVEFLRAKYEAMARSNLARSIASLQNHVKT